MYSISFNKNGNSISLKSTGVLNLYTKCLEWLYKNGYNFKGEIHNQFVRKIFNKEELEKLISSTNYKYSNFYNISNSDNYIQISKGNIDSRIKNIILMLTNFGIDPSTIKTEGFDIKKLSKIKKFDEIEDDNFDPELEPVQSQSEPSENPFKQAICVLGKSGAGKSYTIEEILENEKHEYQIIIPTSATTGILSQFSPSKSTYIPSRLGRMLIEASENPDTLYTAVFDECHKPITIEMINDELLQAISLKRNRYRFISLDDDTSKIYDDSNLKTKRGNIKIPDNFGFIFISSKPEIIKGNDDFFNRVDLIELTEYDRKINNINDLLSKSVESKDDKVELIGRMKKK